MREQKNSKRLCIPRKPRKQVWVSRAEIQALAVDTRTAVWVSTPEKIILRKSQEISRMFQGVLAPALYKNQAVSGPPATQLVSHRKGRWAKSPIASAQRTRSTLASHSAIPRGS